MFLCVFIVFVHIFEQLLVCDEDRLCEFTSPDSALDIGDLLMSAGYPHVRVTADRRRLAYECCLIYEVVPKRIPALNDIRKGLQRQIFGEVISGSHGKVARHSNKILSFTWN